MAWIFSAESVESVLRSTPGCGQSATSRTTDIVKGSCSPESETETLKQPQSGMTSRLSSPGPGLERWISSLLVFHVKISALREMARAWKESAADYFGRSLALLARYDRPTSSWKTFQLLLDGEAERWSEPLPRWGMTVDGACYRLSMWERITRGTDGGVLPTLTVSGNYNRKGVSKESGDGLVTTLKKLLPTLTAHDYRGGATPQRTNNMQKTSSRGADLPSTLRQQGVKGGALLNPSWAEPFMGYPLGWTVLGDLETQWFQRVQEKRSRG